MMSRKKALQICMFCILCSIFLQSGCARFTPGYDEPSVGLKTFRLLPAEGLIPTFEIGLHIINPNSEPLRIKGIYYTIAVEGHRVLAGVADDLPEIKGYGEADITIEATVDLLSGVRLLRSLLIEPATTFAYTFNAKLDMGPFLPTMNIVEKGQLATDSL